MLLSIVFISYLIVFSFSDNGNLAREKVLCFVKEHKFSIHLNSYNQ